MGTKLFVGNVNPRTTKSELAEFFSTAGRVEAISIPIDRESGQPRGFCFVEFADRDAAEEAFEVCDGRQLDGRELRLSWAREREESSRRQRVPGRSFEEDESGRPEKTLSRSEPSWSEDYTEKRRSKPQQHGKHGSDRKRRHGTRRVIE